MKCCCDTTWLDYLSTLGPVIAAGIASFIANSQRALQKRQHNLSLLERRFDFWKSIQTLGQKAMSFPQDREKGAFWSVYNEINEQALTGSVLFGDDCRKEFENIAKFFKERQLLIDDLKDFDKFSEECPDMYSKEKKATLIDKKIRFFNEESTLWSNLASHIFDKIRELKV